MSGFFAVGRFNGPGSQERECTWNQNCHSIDHSLYCCRDWAKFKLQISTVSTHTSSHLIFSPWFLLDGSVRLVCCVHYITCEQEHVVTDFQTILNCCYLWCTDIWSSPVSCTIPSSPPLSVCGRVELRSLSVVHTTSVTKSSMEWVIPRTESLQSLHSSLLSYDDIGGGCSHVLWNRFTRVGSYLHSVQ